MPRRQAERTSSLTSQDSCSAVIIADLVAQVEDKHDLHGDHAKRIDLEHNNLAYDSTLESSPAAIVNVDFTETVDLHKPAKNGLDISKGIILNANHISESSFEKSVKTIELSNKEHSVKTSDASGKGEDCVGGFKNMSFSRKTAFVFSFLPSIMFVLCFAVILPCKEPVPCVNELWNNTLYDTVITNLKAPGNLVYPFSKGSSGGVAIVTRKDGIELWQGALESKPQSIECGYIENVESVSCLVTEVSGTVHFVNITQGGLKKGKLNNAKSPPAILPACQKAGLQPVAMSASATVIKVSVDWIMNILISVDCDQPPSRLTPWVHGNETYLLFLCKKGSDETLMTVPSSRWCSNTVQTTDKAFSLISRPSGSLASSLFLATETGLLVWIEDEVLLLDKNGKQTWSMTSGQHGNSNRFVLFGNFRKSGKEFALFSNSDNKDLQVSILKENKTLVNPSIPNVDLKDVKLINGKEKDFVLIAHNKIDPESKSTSELSFMQLDTQPRSLTPFWQQETDQPDLSLTVSRQSSESMSIFVLRQSLEEKQSQITSLSIQNWDLSASENAQCYWKA